MYASGSGGVSGGGDRAMAVVVWYGLAWYGLLWAVMVWYGMVWYGMEGHATGTSDGAGHTFASSSGPSVRVYTRMKPVHRGSMAGIAQHSRR